MALWSYNTSDVIYRPLYVKFGGAEFNSVAEVMKWKLFEFRIIKELLYEEKRG